LARRGPAIRSLEKPAFACGFGAATFAFRAKVGGSGGARTRYETLQIKALRGLPSQIASQISGVLGHDLASVVIAWADLPPPLKAAILAIVTAAFSNKG
jgi:hypothetical protein